MGTIVWQGFVGVLPYLIIVGLTLFGFKLIHDWLTRYDDDAEVRSGNFAVGLQRGAMYLGVTLAMAGPLLSEQDTYWLDLGSFALEGVIAVVIMTLASFVFDRFMLPHVNRHDQLLARNKAVAVLEAFGYIGLGFIMLSSFAGSGTTSFWRDIASGALFSGLGLLTLMTIYGLYTVIYHAFRGRRVSEEIADGNVAMAVQAGAVVLAMSIVLGFSIIGEFTGWANDIASYFLAAVFGVLSVAVAQLISWLVFIRDFSSRKGQRHSRNLGSASINAMLLLSFGVVSGLATFA